MHLGYEEVAIETFYDMFIELLEDLFSMTPVQLLGSFQEDGHSDYYTWFMRLLTAGAIRGQGSRFLPFLSDDVTISTVLTGGESDEEVALAIMNYCRAEVEPMGKECEQVHIIALAELLGVVISIEYLDGHAFEVDRGLSRVVFNESEVVRGAAQGERRRLEYFAAHPVCLLYRPGHFDILYHKD